MQQHMMESDPAEAVKYIWSRSKPFGGILSIIDYNSVKRILSDSSGYFSAYESQKYIIVERSLPSPGVCASPPTHSAHLNLPLQKIAPMSFSLSKEDKYNWRLSGLDDARIQMTTGSNNLQEVIFKPTLETATYFAEKTRSLMNAKSFSLVGDLGMNVDIVKDVINLLPVHWISHIVSCDLISICGPK